MRDERTEAEKLAFTLDYLVKEGCVPGLLPKDVTAAAALLREQEKELLLLREAQAAKTHVVKVSVESSKPYSRDIEAQVIITDPLIYHGKMRVDDLALFAVSDRHDFALHVTRQLVSICTEQWIRDIQERTFPGVVDALRGDETPKTGGRAKMGMSENG